MKIVFYCTDDSCNGQMGQHEELEFNTSENTAVQYGRNNRIAIWCDTCERRAVVKVSTVKSKTKL